ncbi:ROK family transcriptional regulator [Bacillus sp. HMF5848]|uniref:ROK family transcriptional regulator n=1 Tax=Bacillus sp. HMF5848 TaxID=2495421 RepID=UPI000F78BFDC|nr:ROK family transcriptional regulator [Bacillus sp. HMF5848]RSK28300.1 ROK family transcriptional regulator [Bacillus sp. HMF5848]
MTKLRKADKSLIKDMNRSAVINAIKRKGPISRTEIAQVTNLGQSTMTKIIEELKALDLVHEKGEAHSTGGRKAILLEFNNLFAYAIGIKIMQDHLICALTDLQATIIDKREIFFDPSSDSQLIINLMIRTIHQILIDFQLDSQNLIGIGIAVSGLVDSKTGVVLRSPLLDWNNVDISTPLKEEFQLPVSVDNDVNAYTYAELEFGYGKNSNQFICISIGDGIGSGFIINRKVYKGEYGGAGEFGHTIINVDGRPCHCGQNGCLETYLSNRALNLNAQELASRYPTSSLYNEKINYETITKAAKNNDDLAHELFGQVSKYLSIGLINAINSFNPKTIILIGEALVGKDFFIQDAIKKAKDNFFRGSFETNIVVSNLGDDAWIQGAALQAIDQLFQPPIYEEVNSLIST